MSGSAIDLLRHLRAVKAAAAESDAARRVAVEAQQREVVEHTRAWLAEQVAAARLESTAEAVAAALEAVKEVELAGIRPRGAWERTAEYRAGDAVEHEGSSYLATAPSKGQRPPGVAWFLLAKKGKDGAAGKSGVVVSGGAFSPAALPLAKFTPRPTDTLVLERDGVAYRITIARLQAVFGSGGGVPANAVTINGEPLTIDGEFVTITE